MLACFHVSLIREHPNLLDMTVFMLPFGNIAPTYALFASIIRLGKVNSGLPNRFVQHYNYFDHVPLYLRLFLSFTRFV